MKNFKSTDFKSRLSWYIIDKKTVHYYKIDQICIELNFSKLNF